MKGSKWLILIVILVVIGVVIAKCSVAKV